MNEIIDLTDDNDVPIIQPVKNITHGPLNNKSYPQDIFLKSRSMPTVPNHTSFSYTLNNGYRGFSFNHNLISPDAIKQSNLMTSNAIRHLSTIPQNFGTAHGFPCNFE